MKKILSSILLVSILVTLFNGVSANAAFFKTKEKNN